MALNKAFVFQIITVRLYSSKVYIKCDCLQGLVRLLAMAWCPVTSDPKMQPGLHQRQSTPCSTSGRHPATPCRRAQPPHKQPLRQAIVNFTSSSPQSHMYTLDHARYLSPTQSPPWSCRSLQTAVRPPPPSTPPPTLPTAINHASYGSRQGSPLHGSAVPSLSSRLPQRHQRLRLHTAKSAAGQLGAADLPPDSGRVYEEPIQVFPRIRERDPYRRAGFRQLSLAWTVPGSWQSTSKC